MKKSEQKHPDLQNKNSEFQKGQSAKKKKGEEQHKSNLTRA